MSDKSTGRTFVSIVSDGALWVLGPALLATLPFLTTLRIGTSGREVYEEGLVVLAATVAYVFVRKLRIPVLTLGWSFATLGMLADMLDEFQPSPELYNLVETSKAIGLPLIAVGFFLSYRTIQEHLFRSREAETALRESEAQFRRLFDEAPVGYHEAGPDGVIRRANMAFHRLLEAEPESLLGRRVTDLIWPADRGTCGVALGHLSKLDNGTRSREIRYVREDGEPRTMEVHENTIRDVHGTVIGVRTALLDVTDRKEMEEERVHLETRLRQAQKLETIGTLAGGIAHDFNNLLTPIIGYVDLALEDLGADDPLREDLNQVKAGAARGKELVRQILAFGRANEPARVPVGLGRVVEEGLVFVRASLPTTIEIRTDIAPECPPVLADATQLQQVFMNLCANASQAMAPYGGTLNIQVTPFFPDRDFLRFHPALTRQPYARLTVRDTGRGIPSDVLERVFDPFFTTKGVGEGTGLGLSVAHGIVSGHQGTILAESVEGEGSSFHVYLPTLPEGNQEDHGIPAESEASVGTERILLVDDDPPVLAVMRRMLERAGFQVETSGGGKEALERLARMHRPIDLVLTDLTMPRLTGLQLSAEAKRLFPDLPILLATGYGDELDPVEPLRAGVYEVLRKPLRPAELTGAVRRALDSTPVATDGLACAAPPPPSSS